MAERVRVFEVGPRDGLQNEPRPVSLPDKLWFVEALVSSGIRHLELGAFVRPDKVPQMADTPQIYRAIALGELDLKGAQPWCLVPNLRGLQLALRKGARNIAVFTAATDSFTRRNIGMTVRESLREFKRVVGEAKAFRKEILVRGYVSTAFGCPFEGKVSPRKPLRVVEALADMGCDEISIGDTIGVGTPNQVNDVLGPALKLLGPQRVAGHFHDTRGTALANALRALELGVRIFDSSAGGLGGCPFAPSATGNLATEDLVYLLNGMGLKTGIDLERLCQTSIEFSRRIQRPISGRYLLAYAAACERTGRK